MAFIDSALAWLTLGSGIIILIYFLEYLAIKIGIKSTRSHAWDFFGKHAVVFAFVVSLVAMLGSLYYSDFLGYAPCKLCWYQRIFMYSQVFIFGLALWKGEKKEVWGYSAILSIIGAVIAGFHYYIQMASAPIISIPCSTVGYSAACTETFATSLGYITIPMMALSAFLLIIILNLVRSRAGVH